MSQQFCTNFAPVGHWGVPQTLNNARNTSNSSCKRSVCSRPFQLEYTSDKSARSLLCRRMIGAGGLDNLGAVDRGTFSSQHSPWQLAPTSCW